MRVTVLPLYGKTNVIQSLHSDECRVSIFAVFIYRHDIGMIQVPGRPGFPLKSDLVIIIILALQRGGVNGYIEFVRADTVSITERTSMDMIEAMSSTLIPLDSMA